MPENFIDAEFPIFGIDQSDAFSDQRPQTTATGVNVVGFEPSSGRARGGSRPGLTRFIDSQLTGPIQMLNIVISTSADALAAGITSPPPIIYGGAEPNNPGEVDPSSNNGPIERNPGPRRVRLGGNGVTTNRNIPATSPPPPPPPGTNRFQIKTSLNPKPQTSNTESQTPDVSPDGAGTTLRTVLSFNTDNGEVFTAGAPYSGAPDEQSRAFTASGTLKLPTKFIFGPSAPAGTLSGQGPLNVVQLGNNTSLTATRNSWVALKGSLGGDLRVLFIDRTVDKVLGLDDFFASYGESGLGSVTVPDNNVTTTMSTIFGTAIDKVDYTPIAYGDNIPGSSDYLAGQAAEAAAIAAWVAAHPP